MPIQKQDFCARMLFCRSVCFVVANFCCFCSCFRLTIKAKCPMELRNFPMDRQSCPLILGSCMYTDLHKHCNGYAKSTFMLICMEFEMIRQFMQGPPIKNVIEITPKNTPLNILQKMKIYFFLSLFGIPEGLQKKCSVLKCVFRFFSLKMFVRNIFLRR